MSHKTNIIVPLTALLLVTLAPPGAGVSCSWEGPATILQAESPVWFVTLLDFLHSEKPAADSQQNPAWEPASRTRSALPHPRIPNIAD